ncbi:GCG_CRPN prefix-to-repeats domain-containing protein [Mycobacteroides franklinii]|uniref:GCG_CRPN prefix-to-repeats domain-containing protein n=1 Tax=Mycobacteroides franklinii TaxID=948102 RepID=UPI003AF9D5EA
MFAELAGLGVPEPHHIAEPQLPRPTQWGLYFPGTLRGLKGQTCGPGRHRNPAGACRPTGDIPAAEHGGQLRSGFTHYRQRERGGRIQVQAAVVVEQCGREEARPGGQFGGEAQPCDAGKAAGAAGVHQLQRSGPIGAQPGAHRVQDTRKALAEFA